MEKLAGLDEKFQSIISSIWNFQLLKIEQNPVTTGTIVMGIAAVAIGIAISRYVSHRVFRVVSKRFDIERSASYTLERLFFYILSIFSILFAMKLAHLPLTIFTVLGGAVAIGVGFGSQNIVNNFISGLILMVERPIKIGDYVEVDGIFGEVEYIGLRSTNVHAQGNRHIIVPNSSFLEKNVLNWTRFNRDIRIFISVGVAYGSPTEKVKELLIEAVKGEPRVKQNVEPLVFFRDFGSDSLNFDVLFMIELRSVLDRAVVESNIRFRIDKLFREGKITIAFPQRDVHLFSQEPISVRLDQS